MSRALCQVELSRGEDQSAHHVLVQAALSTLDLGRQGPAFTAHLELLGELTSGLAQPIGRARLEPSVSAWRILHQWDFPEAVCLAGLFCKAYEAQTLYDPPLYTRLRNRVRERIGHEAEQLAHVFHVLDRRTLLRSCLPILEGAYEVYSLDQRGDSIKLNDVTASALYAIELANLADQTCHSDRSPGRWLAAGSHFARLAAANFSLPEAVFDGGSRVVTSDDELHALESYRGTFVKRDSAQALRQRIRHAYMVNPWTPEPALALGQLELEEGRPQLALNHAHTALSRLLAWGTVWDKRHTWEDAIHAALALESEASVALLRFGKAP
jgi:hypothetical protein